MIFAQEGALIDTISGGLLLQARTRCITIRSESP
jgi:hypothetical protein